MSIHPIDLSTVYSQMDKVAKYNASQNQALQAFNQNFIEKSAQAQLEKSKTVQEAAQNESSSTKIKKDGSGAGGGASGQGSRKKDGEGESESQSSSGPEFTDPRLGLHIDIQG